MLDTERLYELDLELDLIADDDREPESTSAAQLRRYVRRLCRDMTKTVAAVRDLERRGWAARFSAEGRAVALSVRKSPPAVVADLRAARVRNPALTGWEKGEATPVRMAGGSLVAVAEG